MAEISKKRHRDMAEQKQKCRVRSGREAMRGLTIPTTRARHAGATERCKPRGLASGGEGQESHARLGISSLELITQRLTAASGEALLIEGGYVEDGGWSAGVVSGRWCATCGQVAQQSSAKVRLVATRNSIGREEAALSQH